VHSSTALRMLELQNPEPRNLSALVLTVDFSR